MWLRRVMMVADQFHGQGGRARLGGQVCAPFGMVFGHHERQSESVRSSFRPAPGRAAKEALPQHDHDPVENGKRHQDFSHIVQECRCQYVRVDLS